MSATATATQLSPTQQAPLVPVDESPALTHAIFKEEMTKIRAHYVAANNNPSIGLTQAYALPIQFTFASKRALQLNNRGTAALNATVKASKDRTLAFTDRQKNAINAATKQAGEDHNLDKFKAAMEAQKQRAKDESNKNIDETFNSLIKQGEEHPEQQEQIMTIANSILGFLSNLLHKFVQVALKIFEAVKAAWDWLKGAAAWVGDKVKDLAADIGHFFGNLI